MTVPGRPLCTVPERKTISAWPGGCFGPTRPSTTGVSHYERDLTDEDRFYDGRFVLYRWHTQDPVVFHNSLHASIEAGHANDCAQRYESLAFWYGRDAASTKSAPE